MTSYSRYPRMMAAAGLPMSALVDRMLRQALRRAQAPGPRDGAAR
jgi:D-alanine--(R)-lactate ligase